jgi:hypothetical protein
VDSLHPAGDTQRLVLYVDMVARRCRVAPPPKLLSLKDQVAATAASLASISLDAPLAACGVDPPFPQDPPGVHHIALPAWTLSGCSPVGRLLTQLST